MGDRSEAALGRLIAARARRAVFQVAKGDATLAQIVGGHLQGHAVAGQDADAVFAHLAAGVGHQLMAVFQGDAIAHVGQDLVDLAVHFNQFFFGHDACLVGEG